jgi:tRNA(fMet)-specific endonuclease VapC
VKYLLDTNSCIEQLRGKSTSPISIKLVSVPSDSVAICSIVVGELLYGANHSANPAQNLTLVRRFCEGFASLPFDDLAAEEYGAIRNELANLGTMIGPNDLLIAAIAKTHGLILVTHNTKEFSRLSGLQLEDWQ